MSALYPEEVILLAARECARKQKDLESVLKLLRSWHDRGFRDEEQIREHVRQFHERESFMKELRGKWSAKGTDVGEKSLQMLEKWENEYGFSREMITKAADSAYEVRKPIAYMDRILTYWAEKGIHTPEAAEKDRRENRNQYQESAQKTAGKKVNAQQYAQRDYSGEDEEALRRWANMPETGND